MLVQTMKEKAEDAGEAQLAVTTTPSEGPQEEELMTVGSPPFKLQAPGSGRGL